MKYILNSNEIYHLDSACNTTGHISKYNLMENAGRAIAKFIVEEIKDPFNKNFVTIVGPGNNGNDGIICNYYLQSYGCQSSLLLTDNNIINNDIYKNFKSNNDNCSLYSNKYIFKEDIWYIDAIFGIGLNRSIEDKYKIIIEKLNNNNNNIISIDMPSGLNVNTGLKFGSIINAKMTLSLGYNKVGHYFNYGLTNCGEIHTLDIGYPNELIKTKKYIQLVELTDIKRIKLSELNPNVNKYEKGKIYALVGSNKYPGAGILALKAANHAGSGIIKALIPYSNRDIYESNLFEPIFSLVNHFDDILDDKQMFKQILEDCNSSNVILLGSGLNEKQNFKWLVKLLKNINTSVVLDATGFIPIVKGEINIKDLPEKIVLTPHYHEFSRLFNINLNILKNNPIETVESIIDRLEGRALILKGKTNIIVNTKGEIFLNNHGNRSLAKAGTGDVLSGILASFISQGYSIDEAILYATFVHAECAHQYKDFKSSKELIASDLIDMLPFSLDSVR